MWTTDYKSAGGWGSLLGFALECAGIILTSLLTNNPGGMVYSFFNCLACCTTVGPNRSVDNSTSCPAVPCVLVRQVTPNGGFVVGGALEEV